MNVRKSLTLSTMEYYITHLSIINTIIPLSLRLTPREIDVLAAFLTLHIATRFTTIGRKQIRDTLSLSPSSLSNHIKSLIAKKFIIASPDDGVTPIDIAANIIPTSTQEYHIRITHDPTLPETLPLPYDEEEENHNLINIYDGPGTGTTANEAEREETKALQANY